MTKPKTTNKHERVTHLRWVPVAKMRVPEVAQREENPSRVSYLAAHFDPELLTPPVVSERGGHFWIMDGQHRVAAFKDWIGEDWITQQVQCWTYTGLTEATEAEMFLKLNDTLNVGAFDKFRIGVTAGRDMETDIDRVVRATGLVVSKQSVEGGIRAVGALRKVYSRGGASVLNRSLSIIRDAYGDPGLEAPVIEGLGLVCSRYNGELDQEKAVKQLASFRGGVGALMQRAELSRKQTGAPRSHCVAAAAVEVINRGKGGKKLPGWWQVSA